MIKSIKSTSRSDVLWILYANCPLHSSCNEDKLLFSWTVHTVYVCTLMFCKLRELCNRKAVSAHKQGCLTVSQPNSTPKRTTSFILTTLTSGNCSRQKRLKVIPRIPPLKFIGLRQSLLNFTKLVAMSTSQPLLCVRKNLVKSLLH